MQLRTIYQLTNVCDATGALDVKNLIMKSENK